MFGYVLTYILLSLSLSLSLSVKFEPIHVLRSSCGWKTQSVVVSHFLPSAPDLHHALKPGRGTTLGAPTHQKNIEICTLATFLPSLPLPTCNMILPDNWLMKTRVLTRTRRKVWNDAGMLRLFPGPPLVCFGLADSMELHLVKLRRHSNVTEDVRPTWYGLSFRDPLNSW